MSIPNESTPTDGAPDVHADAPPDSPAAAVQAKAAEVLRDMEAEQPVRRGRGRPRGSKTRNRAGRGAAARVEAAPEPPAPPAEPTDAEIHGLAVVLEMGWRMVGARLRRRPLAPPEAEQLARAAHPVLAKYGGSAFEAWGAEITLAVTVFGLWQMTELPPEPDQGAEVFELGGGPAA